MVGSLDLIRLPLGVAQREAIRLRRTSPPEAIFSKVLLAVRLRAMPLPVSQLTTFGYLGLWPDVDGREAFRTENLRPGRARRHLALDLRPVQSFGTWQGIDPLAGVSSNPDDGPVLLVTHSRTRAASMARFMMADGPVVRALSRQGGHLWAGGFMDGILTLDSGTLSLWRSTADATRFAYAPGVHQEAVKSQRQGGWFSESWFARFAVTRAEGDWRGIDPTRLSRHS
ncbi:MAG TPA: hypothetical protein VGC49_01015 [Solirubrobacterales bacterium]|jgi:hypothetical protein